jgi:hydrogenase expression/formation protein HypD
MRYVDAFRNPDAARVLRERIARRAEELGDSTVRIMEVCGTHTMAIARNGIKSLLPAGIDLISGPGCPVCVTDSGYIDASIELARRGSIVVTFGDMVKTPGSESSLAACRAEGGRVEICYSPSAAVSLAKKNPQLEVVFLAIGFETTIAPVVSLVGTAISQGIENLSLLTAFKVVPPALEVLAEDPEIGVNAFLCPAHVSAIIGARAYEPVATKYGLPCVIAGFEPLDILLGIDGILKQITDGEGRVENQYSRIVRHEGNLKAQAVIAKYLEPADVPWRGLGTLPGSGLKLRSAYGKYDAELRFELTVQPGTEPVGCLCGDVIKGKSRPEECQLFGRSCTPDNPIGPCMVSQEGSCSASYKYQRGIPERHH